MQKHALKFSILLYFVLVSLGLKAQENPASAAQSPKITLQQADSLYRAGSFMRSLDQYKGLLQQGKSSPAMLLKMARIEEGRQRPVEAMYYLSLYEAQTGSWQVMNKLEQLAKANGLKGYEITDQYRGILLLNRYGNVVQAVFLGMVLLGLFVLGYLRKKQKRIHPVNGILAGVFMVLMLLIQIALYQALPQYAQVENNQTYALEGPSAAAPLAQMLQAGHRVTIVGQEDMWVQIQLDKKTLWVKQKALRPIN